LYTSKTFMLCLTHGVVPLRTAWYVNKFFLNLYLNNCFVLQIAFFIKTGPLDTVSVVRAARTDIAMHYHIATCMFLNAFIHVG